MSSNDIDKVTYAFNKFFGVLVRDIKDIDETFHQKIKQNYKVIDKASSEYMELFWSTTKSYFLEDKSFLDNAQDIEVVKDVRLKELMDSPYDDQQLTNLLYTLGIFAYIKNCVTDQDVNSCFETSIRALGALQKGDVDAYNDEVEDVLDEDLKKMYSKLKVTTPKADAPTPESSDAMDDIFEKFGNSKICEIAKEVSKNIDISSLHVESPDDVYKLLDFSGSNNVLGNIVQQVTNTISTKMSNGELTQQDLMQEAMTMMGSLGGMGGAAGLFNNPMVASMMKNMAKGKTNMRTDVINKMAARERLRKKLELRKETNKEK